MEKSSDGYSVSLIASAALMFASRRMTLHAILEIGDSLLQVLRANFRFIMLMTAIAGISTEIGWVTGDTRDRPALAMIERECVLSIENRRSPGCGGMAGGAICPERARVEDRIGVTGNTGAGRPRKLDVGVALLAVDLLVCAGQREVAA